MSLVRRSTHEREALARAKATLDGLGFYPTPVDIGRVRIVRVPWLFRLPWFRRFDGYELGPLILIRPRVASAAHGQLCDAQDDRRMRM